MKYALSMLTAFALFFSACQKYETQFEGPYEDGDNNTVPGPKYLYQIACVQGGALFLVDHLLRTSKAMPTTGSVKSASINYSHDRIAWKTANGNITIMDSTGAQLETVPSSAGAKWFDWHPNNRTLYMLMSDYSVKTHGPSVTLATTNAFAPVPFLGNPKEITSIAVRNDGAMLIGYTVYDGLNYQNGIVSAFPPGTGTNVRANTQYEIPTRIRLREDGTEAAVTLTDISGFNQNQTSFSFGQTSVNYTIATGGDFIVTNSKSVAYIFSTPGNAALASNSNSLTISPGTGAITDLDW